MPDTTASCWAVAGPEIARTEAKKEGRDVQERSLRGTVSVDKGMAMKRVVLDCLCGVSGVDDEVDDDGEGWW